MFRILIATVLLLGLVPKSAIGQLLPQVQTFGKEEGFHDGNLITDVQASSNHNIYILTIKTIHRFDGTNFYRIQLPEEVKGPIYRFNENKVGTKYFVDTYGQVFVVQEHELVPFALNDTLLKRAKKKPITDVYIDTNQTLHIAYKNGTYLSIDSNYQVREILQEQAVDFNGVACLLLDGDRPFITYCRSKSSKGAQRYFYLMDEEGNLLDQQLIDKRVDFFQPSVTQLANGNFLLAVFKSELIEFNQTDILQKIPYDKSVTRLLTDSYGGLWISTNKLVGTYYYPNGKVDTGAAEILFPRVAGSATTEDFQQGIWIHSTEIGLNRIANPTIQEYSRKTGVFTKNYLSAFGLNNQTLYVSEKHDQVLTYDLNNRSKDSIQLPTKNFGIYDLHYDEKQEALWIGGRGEVLYAVGKKVRRLNGSSLGKGFSVRFRDQPQDSAVSFAMINGNKYLLVRDSTITQVSEDFPDRLTSVLVVGDSNWVGTRRGLYLKTRDSTINISSRFPQFDDQISSIGYFNRIVWISTLENGLWVLKNDSLIQVRVNDRKVNACQLIPRNSRELWAISGHDVLKFSLEDIPNHFTNTHLELFPALLSITSHNRVFNQNSIFWLLSQTGVIQTDFDHIERRQQTPPQLDLVAFRINGVPQNFDDTLFHLSHHENNIDLSFSGIGFENRTLYYRYRIGDQSEWTLTYDPRFHFAALAPGDYTLEVQVSDHALFPGNPHRLHFKIASPFWQRWWFIVLCGLVFTLIIYYGTNFRNRIRSREKDLTIKRLSAEQKVLRAKMDPHFVFNIVASLQYLVQSGDNKRAGHFLEKLSAIMRSTLDQTSKDVTSVHDEVQFLTDYMEMERLRLEGKFDFEIRVDDAVNRSGRIPNFIIQPLIENAIHHGIKSQSRKGKIDVHLSSDQEFLKVTVTDNGIGYAKSVEQKAQKERKRQSYGLETVERRLLAHNGKNSPDTFAIKDLGMSDSEQSGTQINLRIKWEK